MTVSLGASAARGEQLLNFVTAFKGMNFDLEKSDRQWLRVVAFAVRFTLSSESLDISRRQVVYVRRGKFLSPRIERIPAVQYRLVDVWLRNLHCHSSMSATYIFWQFIISRRQGVAIGR